ILSTAPLPIIPIPIPAPIAAIPAPIPAANKPIMYTLFCFSYDVELVDNISSLCVCFGSFFMMIVLFGSHTDKYRRKQSEDISLQDTYKSLKHVQCNGQWNNQNT